MISTSQTKLAQNYITQLKVTYKDRKTIVVSLSKHLRDFLKDTQDMDIKTLKLEMINDRLFTLYLVNSYSAWTMAGDDAIDFLQDIVQENNLKTHL